MKAYSLRKSKKILLAVDHLFRQKKKRLLPAQVQQVRGDLLNLQEQILQKNADGATYAAEKALGYALGVLKKSPFERFRGYCFQIVFALAVAFLIRQCWFELYQIPTGSMRPTFKEKDHLIVSKTTFGINVPFTTDHLYFDPDLVKRSGTFVFTVKNMDVHDADTRYFWLFPGKKQFVKRMMGKPGDTLYFYGGEVYGIDQEGKDISDQFQLPSLEKIGHVPFMQFEGNLALSEPFHSSAGNGYRMAIIHQMNEPVARLTALGTQRFEGQMLYTPRIHNRNVPPVKNYYDLWGIGNYATARMVSKSDVKSFAEQQQIPLGSAQYYLELLHHPDLNHIGLKKDFHGRIRPGFVLSRSILPLSEKEMKKLFQNLYTARFVVKNGFAKRYSYGGAPYVASHALVRLEGVPDGTYEFYYGVGYKVGWGGVAKKLKPGHPLMSYSPERLQKLFNFGIDFNKIYAAKNTSRFAYFRKGNLFVMDAPLFERGDPTLESFLAIETARGKDSGPRSSYVPFVDEGPPLDEEGKLDLELIKQRGLLIPQNSYLALGDNYAGSSDSRDFGFVPEGNLRGTPSFIFWPPCSRLGAPNQPPYPWLSPPNIIVWSLALICLAIWMAIHRRHHQLPLKDL